MASARLSTWTPSAAKWRVVSRVLAGVSFIFEMTRGRMPSPSRVGACVLEACHWSVTPASRITVVDLLFRRWDIH
jgi:hypothetical protein